MPIYEFYSDKKHRLYSFYARKPVGAPISPRCPDDPSLTLQRVLSPFAITGRHREPAAENPDEPLDPKQEAAMMNLAREMEGLNEENPDPKQLGQLIRRMSEISGEPMPEAMGEMLRRMEAGEDPERLEEEYGDALDAASPEEPGAESRDTKESVTSRWLRRHRPPSRDPKLYELTDYL